MRGSYRCVYTAIWDDEKFVRLGREGQQFWFLLRCRLGLSGIDVVTLGELQGRAFARSLDGVVELLELLQTEDWICYRELLGGRVLVWMRNALRFEPHVSLGSWKTVKGVLFQLRGLPRDGLLLQFMDHYDRFVREPGVRAQWDGLRAELEEAGLRASPLSSPLASAEVATTSEGASEGASDTPYQGASMRSGESPDSGKSKTTGNREPKIGKPSPPRSEVDTTASDLRRERTNTSESQKRGDESLEHLPRRDHRLPAFKRFLEQLWAYSKAQELMTQIETLEPSQRDPSYTIASDYLHGDIPNNDMARRLFIETLNTATTSTQRHDRNRNVALPAQELDRAPDATRTREKHIPETEPDPDEPR